MLKNLSEKILIDLSRLRFIYLKIFLSVCFILHRRIEIFPSNYIFDNPIKSIITKKMFSFLNNFSTIWLVSFYCMKHSINLFNKQDGLTIHWTWFYRFVFGVYYNTLLQNTAV